METAHCGEVGGESFGVSGLKLLDEEFTLAAITSLALCALGVEGRVATVLLVVALLLMGIGPPFLNGLAVFAHKHALALAHASEGGKCRLWEKCPTGQPQAGGSECLELHGAFSITLRARGSAPQQGLVFLAGRGAHECFGGVAGCPRSGGDGRVSRFISPAYSADRGTHTPALFLDCKVGTWAANSVPAG
jgi:hypothetical protein